MGRLQRRKFLIASGALLAAPVSALAQVPGPVRRVAWMGLGSPDAPSPYYDSLRAGLRDLGWIEGRNLVLAPFGSTGFPEDAERAAREVSVFNPEVIVAQEILVFAAQRVRPNMPVVFGFSGDPVQAKLVQSFGRPGGALTGMTYLALDLVAKRIELLKELVPSMQRLAVLARPQHPGEQFERRASEEAAARLALEAKLPAVSGWAPFADNGLLLTYGPNIRDLYRGLARYVNRILHGATPAELPVELPRSIELVFNSVTARRLGIPSRQGILVRADRIIE